MVSMLASQNSGPKFSPRSDRNTCSVQCDWWGLLGLIKWMPASHHHSPILQTEGMSLIKQIEAFQLKYYWTVLRIPWTMPMIRSGEHWRTATGSYTATLPRQHWISTALWNISSLVEGVIPTRRGGPAGTEVSAVLWRHQSLGTWVHEAGESGPAANQSSLVIGLWSGRHSARDQLHGVWRDCKRSGMGELGVR